MKNAAVAILLANIMVEGECIIENLPNISDVTCMFKILTQMGAQVKYINKHTIEVNTKTVNKFNFIFKKSLTNIKLKYIIIIAF